MKKLTFLLLLFLLCFYGFSQHITPRQLNTGVSVAGKILLTKTDGSVEVGDTISHYWSKVEITESDTTRWGSSSSTATGEIWTALTGSYASATTFTFIGTDKDA